MSLMFTTVLLSGCLDSVVSKVSPSDRPDHVELKCQDSSSGTCFFLVGQNFETVYEVPKGGQLLIATLQEPQPVCATYKVSKTDFCNTNTTIGPGSNVVTRSKNTAGMGVTLN
jgi:hypothetical protein